MLKRKNIGKYTDRADSRGLRANPKFIKKTVFVGYLRVYKKLESRDEDKTDFVDLFCFSLFLSLLLLLLLIIANIFNIFYIFNIVVN